jgi:hypothetical protein
MQFSTTTLLSVLTTLLPLTSTLPQQSLHLDRRQASYSANSSSLSNFYLVTTCSPTCLSNSSLLPDVSATSFFAPFRQATYLLRLISPGYLSLPQFNLTSNDSLTSIQPDQFGKGSYTYGNEAATTGTELQFAQDVAAGGLSLAGDEGCLLAVGGSVEGWTLCPGALMETVVSS